MTFQLFPLSISVKTYSVNLELWNLRPLEKDENQVQKKRKHVVRLLNKKRKRKGKFHLICDDLYKYSEYVFPSIECLCTHLINC